MFNRCFLLVSAIFCLAVSSRAQDQLQPCSTDEHYHALLKAYPELAAYEEQFNAQLKAHNAYKTTAVADTVTYDLPIVVHVVHDYGNENISDDVIYEAATYWAQVYMKQNADTISVIPPFVPLIGNPKIRLHLATKDPDGNPTKGVKRYMSYLTNVGSDNAKYDSWPNNKYINIWFIGTFGAASAGAAAYAYYPSTAAFRPFYDGVISLASYVNTSKTIPHELGHCLNLQHVWGNTNAPDVACGDDLVDDTPPTKGHNPSGCIASALYDTTCATGYVKTYASALTGLIDSLVDYPDTANAQNIMDYTYCSLMFTKGQCERMRTALTSSTAGRNNLITAANLAETGALEPMPDLPPVAEFIMNKATGAGVISDARTYFLSLGNAGAFTFRNASWNDTISSINWTFSNGAINPTSTSTGLVNNKFSMPGWVTVTLTATSNAGANTIVNPQAVFVADTIPVGGIGYSQNFASATDVSNWPMFNYYSNQFKWEFFTGAGKDDNSCIRYSSYDPTNRRTGSAVGDFDDIYTPAFDLSGLTDDAYFNFFTTGASTTSSAVPASSRVNDSLEIDVTTSGGARWVKLGGFSGASLANNGVQGTTFTPSSTSEWIPRAVKITSAYRTRNTYFRIRFRPGNTGNNVYVDNMYLGNFPAGIQESLNTVDNSFSIFPNPSSGGCNIVFKTGNSGNVQYSIKDVTGKMIYKGSGAFGANSIQQLPISRDIVPAAGMYFVTVVMDGMSATQKMVVY